MNEFLTKATLLASEADAAMQGMREALVAQIVPLEAELAEVKAIAAAVEENLERMKSAVKELDGESQKKPKGKLKSKGHRKDSKPAVKREHIQPVCLALVEAKPGIARDELAAHAADKMLEKGFSRNGLTMQIGKCIDSELFVIDTEGKVVLSSPSTNHLSTSNLHAESDDPELPVESSR